MENCKGTVVNHYYCCGCNGNSDNDANQVGAIVYAHTLLPSHVKADGQLLERKNYLKLFTYAKENNLILPEADWVNDMQGMFAEGDGMDTFRVPDLRGQFLRGVDDKRGVDTDRVLGSQQGDAIRNITGNVVIRQHSNGTNYTDAVPDGCFVPAENDAGSYGTNGYTAPCTRGFDVSRVVPTARENRPKNIALIVQIKY